MKYKKVGVLPIWILVKSSVSSVGPSSERNMTLLYIYIYIYISSTPTFLYFNLYLNTAYTEHIVQCTVPNNNVMILLCFGNYTVLLLRYCSCYYSIQTSNIKY